MERATPDLWNGQNVHVGAVLSLGNLQRLILADLWMKKCFCLSARWHFRVVGDVLTFRHADVLMP
jgi:hypothetical protein